MGYHLAGTSRRIFGNKGQGPRQQYIGINSLPNTRGAAIDQFSNRLFEAQGNPVFNEILAKVMNPSLSWMIDQSDQGQYYLQANNDNHFHN